MATVTDRGGPAPPPATSRNEDHPEWRSYVWLRDRFGVTETFEEHLAATEKMRARHRGDACHRCGRRLSRRAKLYRALGIRRNQSGVQTGHLLEMICHRCWKAGPSRFYPGAAWRAQELPCESCGRPVVGRFPRRYVEGEFGDDVLPNVICSARCRAIRQSEERRAERARAREELRCVTCGDYLRRKQVPSRNDARYCSNACRQKAYRARTS